MPIGIPTICWYTMSPNCIYIYSMRKVKASLNSVQAQHLYESYVLLEKNPALSEVQRYVFDSLLQHHLTRDNTFSLIRSCGNDVYNVKKSKEDTWEPWKFRSRNFFDDLGGVFNGPKIIHITIAEGSFTVLKSMIFDCCESGYYMLKQDVSRTVTRIRYEAWFVRICVQFRQPVKCRQINFVNLIFDLVRQSICRWRNLSLVRSAGTYALVEFNSLFKTST